MERNRVRRHQSKFGKSRRERPIGGGPANRLRKQPPAGQSSRNIVPRGIGRYRCFRYGSELNWPARSIYFLLEDFNLHKFNFCLE